MISKPKFAYSIAWENGNTYTHTKKNNANNLNNIDLLPIALENIFACAATNQK